MVEVKEDLIEEGGEEEGGEGDLSAPVTVTVDGVEYNEDTIRQLQSTSKNTLTDYHKKMEEVKAEKESLRQEKLSVEGEIEFSRKLEAARKQDEKWWSSHTIEEWKEHKGEAEKLLESKGIKVAGTSSSIDGQASELLAEIKTNNEKLQKRIDSLESRDQVKNADLVLDQADAFMKGEYKLADKEAVYDRIFVFNRNNKRLPSKKEIGAIVKQKHDYSKRILATGRLQPKDGGEGITLPSSKGGGAPLTTDKGKKKTTLGNVSDAIDAGEAFFKKKQAERAASGR